MPLLDQMALIDQDNQSLKKSPSENDILDAQVINFYPNDTDINDIRNVIGLVQGAFYFFK